MADILVHNGLMGGGRSISRRELFRIGGAAAAASALAAIGVQQAGRLSAAMTAPRLVRSTFARHIGDIFRIQAEFSGPAALHLFKARDLRSTPALLAQGQAIDTERAFSLLFRGPADRPLGQAVYHFDHEQMGGFDLFIVPMRPEADARYYEAIFN
jgi:hypothetical protein